MSKEELAERLGISSQYVNDIEQGKKCMSMAIFVELGEVFHTGLDELAHGAQKEEPVLEHLLCHLRQLSPVQRDMAVHMLHLAFRAARSWARRVGRGAGDPGPGGGGCPETRLLTEAFCPDGRGSVCARWPKDGLEGLELVEQTRPDIVLLDLILPGWTGWFPPRPAPPERAPGCGGWPPRPRSPQSSGWPFSLGPATIS